MQIIGNLAPVRGLDLEPSNPRAGPVVGGEDPEGAVPKSPLGDITDTVTISPEGREAMAAIDAVGGITETSGAEEAREPTSEEEKEAAELEKRDTRERAQERALGVLGVRDGAGVSVMSVTPIEGDAEATARKMRAVRDAALAPAEASGQNRVVAAKAVQELVRAQIQAEADIGEADANEETAEASLPADQRKASAAGRRAYARNMLDFFEDPKGSILSVVV